MLFIHGSVGTLRLANPRFNGMRCFTLEKQPNERVSVRLLSMEHTDISVPQAAFQPSPVYCSAPRCSNIAKSFCAKCVQASAEMPFSYCCKRCQTSDWSRHKYYCGKSVLCRELSYGDPAPVAGYSRKDLHFGDVIVCIEFGVVIDDAASIALRNPFVTGEHPVLVICKLPDFNLHLGQHKIDFVQGSRYILKCVDFLASDGLLPKDGGLASSISEHLRQIDADEAPPQMFVLLLVDKLQQATMDGASVGLQYLMSYKEGKLLARTVSEADDVDVKSFKRLVACPLVDTAKKSMHRMPLHLTGSVVEGSHASKVMTEPCSICMEPCRFMFTRECCTGGTLCFECATALSDCPFCRAPFSQDILDSNTQPPVIAGRRIVRARCCICSQLAPFRCRCMRHDYCTERCIEAHSKGVDHKGNRFESHKCSTPYYMSSLPDSNWKWDGMRYTQC